MSNENSAAILEMTADLVAAYVSNNPIPVGELPNLIASVNSSLAGLNGQPQAPAEELKPAVNPKKSVFPNYIISLEDGKQFKSLKRALMSRYGLTPNEYRAKWDLPSDYPMVAPAYSAARSEMAKRSGLGRKAAANTATKAKAKSGSGRGRPVKARS